MGETWKPDGSLIPMRSTSVSPRKPTRCPPEEQVLLAVTRPKVPPVPATTSTELDATVIHPHPPTLQKNPWRVTSTLFFEGQVPPAYCHNPWTEAASGAVLEMCGLSFACR